tara:strand:+ start:202 stop:441 length:240 start_codon:yes stop_codon:yes gene_type:complete
MNEYIYEEMQKNNKFEELINTKLYLTKEEADFCISWDPSSHDEIFYQEENKFLNVKCWESMEKSGEMTEYLLDSNNIPA